MNKTLLLVALALGTSFAPAAHARVPAQAAMMDVDGAAVLAEIDRRAAAFDDQSYTATMEIKKGSTVKKTLVFSAVMKGLDKQFINFTAPGDVAGMKVLLEGTNNLYLYLPEFGKVRRVAAHMQNQGFLGSHFTLSDLAEVKLSPLYEATVLGTEGTLTRLSLTPKSGVEAAAAKIEITIDSSKGGVTKLRYFDGSGNAVREQVREEWVKIEGKLVPTRITMSDLKAGDSTVITLSNLKVNQGVADDIFSRRSLLR